jgi:hypothetical protein
MALSTWPSTGTVSQWMYELDVAPERVLGWAALYWDGSGSVNQAQVYASVATPWSTLVADPNTLPETGLQAYLVFWRRWGGMYCSWFDGYDEYYLIGKTNPVLGVLLADQKWNQMQNRIQSAWSNRSAFIGQYTDWTNEV